MKKMDYTFNSEKQTKQSFQLASGYISETVILFENEKITAVIQAKGGVKFCSLHGECIAEDTAPPVNNGREVYEWIDNYPHCDGEHDRWDTRIAGYHSLTFDPSPAH